MLTAETVNPLSQRQTCKVCWRPDYFDFHVPDAVWVGVIPPPYQNRVVCLSCFDAFAHEKGVDYGPHIHTLYFAGDAACFRLKVG